MSRSYGPRFDPDGTQHARVANAAGYKIDTILWRVRVHNGELRCELLRGTSGPAKRPVRLVAEYQDADEFCTRVRLCKNPEEETEGRLYLEGIMLEATRRAAPATPPAGSTHTPASGP